MPQPAAPGQQDMGNSRTQGTAGHHREQQDTGNSRRKSAGTCLTSDGTIPCIGAQGLAGWSAWAPADPLPPRACRRAAVATACGALAPALGLSLPGASLKLGIRHFSVTALY